jgi:hypothetical protein
MGQSKPVPFGKVFALSDAVHVLVDSAARTGTPIRLPDAVRSLGAKFPEAKDEDVTRMVFRAAVQARVPILNDRYSP